MPALRLFSSRQYGRPQPAQSLGALIAFLLVAQSALAACPRGCSNNGDCGANNACTCFPGFLGHDCSERICPFGPSWADVPRGDLNHDGTVSREGDEQYVSVQWSNTKEYEGFPSGTPQLDSGVIATREEAHFYTECSQRGRCNRFSGECRCYEGFTGSACERASCPNACSGHGLCRTVREVAKSALTKRRAQSINGVFWFTGSTETFTYNLWDADMNTACICDPGYTGPDCSLRECPRSDDPLTTKRRWCGGFPCHYSVQKFILGPSITDILEVSFTYWSGSSLTIPVAIDTANDAAGEVSQANAGTRLAARDTTAGKIMNALRNDFPGRTLQRVEVRAADLDGSGSYTYHVTFVGVPGKQQLLNMTIASSGATVAVSYVSSDDAAIQNVEGGALYDSNRVYTLSGNREEIACAGRGACDYSTGLCKCFAGYDGAACDRQNALVY